MAKQTINNGSFIDDPSAESIYTAFGKVNSNFDELYLKTIQGNRTRVVNSDTDVQPAINSLGDRRTIRFTQTSFSYTIGSEADGRMNITGVGTNWRRTTNVGACRVDDLFKFDDETRYYMIDEVVSDTKLIMKEAYQGVKTTGTTTFRTYYIDWATVILRNGEYAFIGIDLLPGIIIQGESRDGVRWSEETTNTTRNIAFQNFSANMISNMTISPTDLFSDMDGFCRLDESDGSFNQPNYYAGMEARLFNLLIDSRNLGGVHTGGGTQLPCLPNGTVYIDEVKIVSDDHTDFCDPTSSGRLDATIDVEKTKVIIRNSSLRTAKSFETPNAHIFPCSFHFNQLATYDLLDVDILGEDRESDSAPSPNPDAPGAILINSAGGDPGAVVNLFNVKSRSWNTGALAAYNLYADGECTVNMFNCDFETDGISVACTNANATVNVYNSRLKGTVNSIVRAAGTVTVNESCELDGQVSGTVGSFDNPPSVYAGIYVEDGAVAQTGIGTTPVLLTGFDTNMAVASYATPDHTFDHVVAQIGGDYEITLQLSFSGTVNATFDFEFSINGTLTGYKVRRKLGTGGDVGSCSLVALLPLVTGDFVDVRVSAGSAGNSITVEQGQLTVRGAG